MVLIPIYIWPIESLIKLSKQNEKNKEKLDKISSSKPKPNLSESRYVHFYNINN
jgi:hypothetical protein